jgi:hypothetical protein
LLFAGVRAQLKKWPDGSRRRHARAFVGKLHVYIGIRHTSRRYRRCSSRRRFSISISTLRHTRNAVLSDGFFILCLSPDFIDARLCATRVVDFTSFLSASRLAIAAESGAISPERFHFRDAISSSRIEVSRIRVLQVFAVPP